MSYFNMKNIKNMTHPIIVQVWTKLEKIFNTENFFYIKNKEMYVLLCMYVSATILHRSV